MDDTMQDRQERDIAGIPPAPVAAPPEAASRDRAVYIIVAAVIVILTAIQLFILF